MSKRHTWVSVSDEIPMIPGHGLFEVEMAQCLRCGCRRYRMKYLGTGKNRNRQVIRYRTPKSAPFDSLSKMPSCRDNRPKI